MATSRALARRHLGQLAVRSKTASVARVHSLPRTDSWVCNRCAVKPSLSPKVFMRTQATSTSADINSVSHSPGLDPTYAPLDTFPRRHIGPDEKDTTEMLKALSPPVDSLDQFVEQVIPEDIYNPSKQMPRLQSVETESTLQNTVLRYEEDITHLKSFIGNGYYGTLTPPVIKRNVLENPAWYTSYTPYQPEISQGRLESLLNFQTLVSDLTALPIANASLLDEGTAASEAMTLSMNALPSSRAKRPNKTYVVSDKLHRQTVAVLMGRAEGFGINVKTMDTTKFDFHQELEAIGDDLIGVMVQYPDTLGGVADHRKLADAVHKQGATLSVATDLLALTLLTPPGEWGADIAFGSAQRFGVPMGFGGPHAAFFAVQEKHKRKMPGRLVGVSKDRRGSRALRLALQTREQHIRREKATSNVCTSQALLANMSALYAIYHGPEGLKAIAERVVRGARALQAGLEDYGYETVKSSLDENGRVLFDTVVVKVPSKKDREALERLALDSHFVIRVTDDAVCLSVDETTTQEDLARLLGIFAAHYNKKATIEGDLSQYVQKIGDKLAQQSTTLEHPDAVRRTSDYLKHPVFNTHHSETELLRYIYQLQSKDLSLVHSMIPLGSCTMKLNGTAEMELITRPKISNLHPFTPHHHADGYKRVLRDLSGQLADITAMDATSLQPNSGAQGEFAGLRVIRKFHKANGDNKRDICLIPVSAHGTNPASAAMAGMRVVPIKCDTKTGNLDVADLEAKCEKYKDELGAIMVTYPSTFGVFEPEVKRVCEIVHSHGGQVYMDGANMNAQIGLCSPGEIGADVCHLNLHKTFCIPHGGGGPGVGPICVKSHLEPFLPEKDTRKVGAVSSAPYGSASISLISWAYNKLMGSEGLKHATKITLLNANYIMSRLKSHYQILYTNKNERCAHEFILDVRPFRETAGIEAIDIAKRLQDYGFHAPTMSWPVANTLMIEPTESESKEELDRFIDALISIRKEIKEVEDGKVPRDANVLKLAPHPIEDIVSGDSEGKWDRSYSREKAAYPLSWLREKKFWPSVARVDDTYGDLNLFCTCPPVEDTSGDVPEGEASNSPQFP